MGKIIANTDLSPVEIEIAFAAAAGHDFAIGIESDTEDFPFVPFESSALQAGFGVPQADHTVQSRWGHQIAVGGKGHAADFLGMARQNSHGVFVGGWCFSC